MLNTLDALSHLAFIITPYDTDCYFLHLANKETKRTGSETIWLD